MPPAGPARHACLCMPSTVGGWQARGGAISLPARVYRFWRLQLLALRCRLGWVLPVLEHGWRGWVRLASAQLSSRLGSLGPSQTLCTRAVWASERPDPRPTILQPPISLSHPEPASVLGMSLQKLSLLARAPFSCSLAGAWLAGTQ